MHFIILIARRAPSEPSRPQKCDGLTLKTFPRTVVRLGPPKTLIRPWTRLRNQSSPSSASWSSTFSWRNCRCLGCGSVEIDVILHYLRSLSSRTWSVIGVVRAMCLDLRCCSCGPSNLLHRVLFGAVWSGSGQVRSCSTFRHTLYCRLRDFWSSAIALPVSISVYSTSLDADHSGV